MQKQYAEYLVGRKIFIKIMAKNIFKELNKDILTLEASFALIVDIIFAFEETLAPEAKPMQTSARVRAAIFI